MASAPYRLERGPRTISTRSIISIGRSCNDARPEVGEPMRMPSTSTSTWSDSVPRRNSVVSLPGPPWLPIEMPARPRSRSGSERAWLMRICSLSITSTGVSASLTLMAVRLEVTTTSSRSVAVPLSCACAEADTASAQAAARTVIGERSDIGYSPTHGLRPCRSQGWSREEKGQAALRAHSADVAAATPSASQPVGGHEDPLIRGRSPDSRVEVLCLRLRRLPVRCTVADAAL